jgi:hypothetical protein
MHEFIVSSIVESFRGVTATKVINWRNNTAASRVNGKIHAIVRACQQIVANYELRSSSLLQDIEWPESVPKLPVLLPAVRNGHEIFEYIFAEVFVMSWVILDARTDLRFDTINILSRFISTVSKDGLKDLVSLTSFERFLLSVPGANL